MVIGADVIVGFPGETDDDFEETRSLIEASMLDYLHVFSYSDRKGTPASALSGKVDPITIRRRNDVLTEISRRLRAAANLRQVGQTLGVIAEHKKVKQGIFWGVADNYTKVKLPMSYDGGRQIVQYEVTEAHDDYVDGRLLW
jgi:threonylcarbamoyladenosine tRNA methylthiotransferase MtaB